MTIFHCQQFSVQQSHSAMKVCSDSILFGAMSPVKQGDRVLDIGAGSGLLSLMAAQKGAEQITAVEICPSACLDAERNFAHSPWQNRLRLLQQDIQSYASTLLTPAYDLIISNPPFFAQQLPSQSARKKLARHNDSLPFAALIKAATQVLTAHGVFYVLLPQRSVTEFIELAQASGLNLQRHVAYRGFADKPAKVSALSFSYRTSSADIPMEMLTIYASQGVYSASSQKYLQSFLMRFASH
jgi:tRNA1Val (adenine37-N6)-methyltransferase